MSGFDFYADILSDGSSGPLAGLTRWEYSARLSRTGSVVAELAASDPQAQHIVNRRQLRGQNLFSGGWQDVGIGIIDKLERVPGVDGRAALRVNGLDILGKMNYRTLRGFEIGAESGATLEEALLAINAEAPLPVSFEIVGTVPNDYFYAKFEGESVLSAIIYLAEKTGVYFALTGSGAGLKITFSATFTASGIRAIQANGNLADDACAIIGLTETIDTTEYLNRTYIEGSGVDRESSLTLAATDRVAPAGYTLNAAESYIQNDAAIAAAGGEIVESLVTFKEIAPISGSDADYVSAANMLFDVGLAELTRRSTTGNQRTYTLAVANCKTLLRPLQTIRLTYRDLEQGLDIDEDLYILEATWAKDARGLQTSRLVVSSEAYWPKSQSDNGAERAVKGRIFQTHPQLSMPEWESHKEILIGNDEADAPIVGKFPFMFGPGTTMVKQVLFRFTVEQVLFMAQTYELAADTGQNDAANTGDTAAGTTTNGGSGTSGATAAGNTVSGGSDTSGSTGPNTGGAVPDAISDTNLGGLATATQPPTGWAGDPSTHYHDIGTHAHDFTHTHVVDGHTHSTPAHTHSITDTHTHSTPNHTHTITDTHNHSSPQHDHPSPALTGTVGLQRVDVADTYTIDQIEIAINGGSYVSLDTATAVGSQWQLDITADVTHPTIPQRPAQADGNNLIEIRRKSAAGGGKTALVVGMLYVRTVIQSVNLSS